MQPPYGPTGEIFRYTLRSDRPSSELLVWQDWVIDRQLRTVPGVADVVSFGGARRVYEVSVNPDHLADFSLTPLDVYSALTAANKNVGGDVIEKNGQAFVVRGMGLFRSLEDIENVLISSRNGVPVLVKHVADVSIGPFLGLVKWVWTKTMTWSKGSSLCAKVKIHPRYWRPSKKKSRRLTRKFYPPMFKWRPFMTGIV